MGKIDVPGAAEIGRVTYENMALTMNEYMRASMSAMQIYRDQFPMHETDVDALVYEALDEERHFEREACSVEEHIAELRDIAKRAPKGAEVTIEFEQDYGYDDDRITVRKVGCWRKPTNEERAERGEHNLKAREHNAALEAAQEAETAKREREELDRAPKGQVRLAHHLQLLVKTGTPR